MGLEVRIEHSQSGDCKTITITDITGDYNGDTNPNGWGSPNPEKTDVTAATLVITKGTNTYTVDLLALGFPVTGEIELDALEITGAEKWIDGEYTMVVTVSGTTGGDPFQSSFELCAYLICISCCCVQKKWVQGKVGDGKHDERILADDLLSILIANAECGELETANEALAELQKLCTDCGCS